MSANTPFNIYVMSRKRAHLTVNLTARIFDYCTYVVREDEEDTYRSCGVYNLLVVPDGAVFDFMSTFYWIVENTPEDVICIADDDIDCLAYRIVEYEPLRGADGVPDSERITSEIERIGQLILDLGVGIAFESPMGALYGYDREFSFKGMPGHLRWINKNTFKAKYNPSDPATSDIDMVMQELLVNRIALEPKYFVCKAHMDTLEGEYEARKEHIDMTIAMSNKWGRHYSYDYKKNRAIINIER